MFKIIVRGCGGAAAALTVIWVTALSLASSDGPKGVEVSYQVTSAIIGVIAVCLVLSVGGWLTRDIIRTENERSAKLALAELARQHEEIASRAVSRLAALNREMITGDLREMIEAFIKRTRIEVWTEESMKRAAGNGNVANIRRGD